MAEWRMTARSWQGGSITVVGAGTQPSRDPDAPVGNGRAIAVRAAREGASVVCVDRDEAAVEETWRLITEEGGKAAVVVADVTTEEGCRLAVSDEPGLAPDGLVLNVGTGFGMGVAGTSHRRLGQDVRPQPARPLHAGAPRPGHPVRQRVHRLHGLGGRPAARAAASPPTTPPRRGSSA